MKENSVIPSVSIDSVNLESLRLAQDYASVLGVQKVLTTVRVAKPTKQIWFQVHPEYEFVCAVLELKDDVDRGFFMVSPAIRET